MFLCGVIKTGNIMKRDLILKLSLSQRIQIRAKSIGEGYARLLSYFLEEKINAGNAFRITHALLAFTVLVFSYGDAIYSVIFLIWFILTLLSCKRAGIK